MTRPNFLIIGAMKAGTTSLYRYLSHHPEVFMSTPKELHFFSHKNGTDLGWYEGYFAAAGEAPAIGEASASYTTHPDAEGVPARIAEVIPDVRLVYLVRHPVDRMRSHYDHRVAAGKETTPIDRALTENPIYIRTSCYAEQVEAYLHHFPRDQLLIVRSEDLRAKRAPTLRAVYAFIGADESWVPSSTEQEFYRTTQKKVPRPAVQVLRRNRFARKIAHRVPGSVAKIGRRLAVQTSESTSEITGDLRQRLEDLVRDDVRRLKTFAGEGFDGWDIA
jgi:hypothetical protein